MYTKKAESIKWENEASISTQERKHNNEQLTRRSNEKAMGSKNGS
jgi:hypothetical protein